MVGRGLQQGARVRTRVATAFVAIGTQGWVLGGWPTIPHGYDVRFDGQSHPWLMWEDELQCLETDSAVSPDAGRY